MHRSISSVGFIFKLQLCLVLLWFHTGQVYADDITIQGDTTILCDTEATFYVTLDKHYPTIFFFGYEFNINFPNPVNVEVLSNTLAKFTQDFAHVPSGTYNMKVEVYIYFFQQKSWKVAEKEIQLTVTDSLASFFQINGKQNDLPKFTPSNIFVPDKLVDLSADLKIASSVLSSNSTKLDYTWTLTGPNSTTTTLHDNSTFKHNFTTAGQYTLTVDITANITSSPPPPSSSPSSSVVKKGTITQNVFIKSTITNANIAGNNFVMNGSLLHLNVSCNGSSNFMICYFFSDSKSNQSCMQSATVVDNCFLEISHYFPNNGTQYINVGVRNDVSETLMYSKITIYKIGPTRSLVFVILPLVSSFLVIVIILSGIAHHIRQRRKLNATIEVATMENFGLYGQASFTEKTFFERIQDSLKDMFRST